MRRFAKLSATLLLGTIAASANAHINVVQARLLSLRQEADRWLLELEIHAARKGGSPDRHPTNAVVHIQRAPDCIVSKQIYLGTSEEFEQALDLLRAQVTEGGIQPFGLNATPVTPKRDVFLAVNLRVFKPGTAEQMVWTVHPETGLDLCPFKYAANR
jgi:hypothetical protein